MGRGIGRGEIVDIHEYVLGAGIGFQQRGFMPIPATDSTGIGQARLDIPKMHNDSVGCLFGGQTSCVNHE